MICAVAHLSVGFGVVTQVPDSRFTGVSRVATARDVPVVADCLASAFFEDPLWGRWTFPDESVRARDIYPFMEFWAETAVRDPWVRMTDRGEAVTVWHPVGRINGSAREQRDFQRDRRIYATPQDRHRLALSAIDT
jgi:hypothetical protein